MDIFTTVLTRVVQVQIKPERLRVKALAKEPSINKLTDDPDHIESHENYVDFSKENSEKQQGYKNKNQHPESILEVKDDIADNCIDEISGVITHKEELIHPVKKHDELDEDIHHLDLFV
ncbi:MAG: hypothetical protein ACJAXS_000580 [Colwellia sp.]|jgi:hypothetical protein